MVLKIRRNKEGKKAGVFSKLVGSLFGFVFFSVGLLFLVFIGQMSLNIIDSYSWDSKECYIISSQVEETSDNENPFRAKVEYSYSVGGKPYRSSRISFNNRTFSSLVKAETFAKQFPKNESVSCLVDPDDSASSILKRDSLLFCLFILLPLIFVLIGGGIIYAIWREGDGSESLSKHKTKKLRFTRDKKSVLAVKLVCVLLIILGGSLTYFLGYKTISNYFAAQSWEKAKGRVITSRIIENESDDSVTYKGYVAYTYEVSDVEYKGDRYSFLDSSSSCHSCARKIIRKHRKGSTVTVFYNPANPEESVLSQEFHWSYLLGFIPSVFLIAGVIGMVRTQKPKQAMHSGASDNNQFPEWLGSPNKARFDGRIGKFALKADHSATSKFFGLTFVAIFWNGIVSIFLFSGDLFEGGTFAVFSILFLIPFVLIGLVLIAAAVHAFFGFWSPQVELALSEVNLRPGGSYRGNWSFKGGVSGITDFSIDLVCKEEIIYSSGDKRRTKKKKVFKETIFSRAALGAISFEEFHFSIPRGLMHSLDTSQSKIVWSLVASAKVKNLPDIDETYKIIMGVAADE